MLFGHFGFWNKLKMTKITSLGDYRGGEWKGDTKTPMEEKGGIVCGLDVSCRHRDGKMEKHSRKDF